MVVCGAAVAKYKKISSARTSCISGKPTGGAQGYLASSSATGFLDRLYLVQWTQRERIQIVMTKKLASDIKRRDEA